MSKSNSSYTPFARKYRPSKFSELLGQEVLVKTLTYCIQNNRLAQAHLLTGIRGVGKTSSARIIAKTVNCTDLQINKEHIIPCDTCKNCNSFNNHSHPDIIEIDAASKTSVDDIREIIESSEYRPLLGRMKFFIIDEVHMLSKSAFNALLKVVEEPPQHVIFIFATTEVQKIPLTVISRCQRYDLRRLTFNEIHQLTSNIAKSENIVFEEEALKIIAIKSEGSARDAVTMIDQASSYAYNASNSDLISAEIVSQMLGLLGVNTILKFTQLIIANDPARAISLVEDIYAKANSLEYFVQTMADFMAELSKSKIIPNYHNPLYQNYSTEISNIIIGTSLSRITTLWQIFSNGVGEIKQSHNELVMAQMLIIKAIYACNLPSIEDIMDASNNLAVQQPAIIDQNQEKPAIEIITPTDEIFEFLKYCYNKADMETYYLLLNEVEVKEFKLGDFVVAGNINIVIAAHIEKLLKEWSGKDWKVQMSKQDKIISLKDKMLDKARQAGDYQVIKNKFPDANISDIILK
tara:strand:- start:7276 stop:8835 length:1560 start_codon:yes stop_codon:yes gene_type:complete